MLHHCGSMWVLCKECNEFSDIWDMLNTLEVFDVCKFEYTQAFMDDYLHFEDCTNMVEDESDW